jgi:7-cyano-7-deazaguanine synthase in queuosine biosynthesis
MEQKTILAMYSGGLDSLGMIYQLLTSAEYKYHRLHIHHVHNRNIEHRNRAEAIMVQQALAELTRLGFEYQYSESEIASQSYNEYFMYDSDSINFFAGYICSANPDVVKVAMGMNATDSNHALEERRKRANAILSAFTPVEKIYPVLNMTKREIYASLPESLRNKFWSCRRPIYTDSGVESCGECKACEQLAEAGIKDEL